jgi:hypothetical protein
VLYHTQSISSGLFSSKSIGSSTVGRTTCAGEGRGAARAGVWTGAGTGAGLGRAKRIGPPKEITPFRGMPPFEAIGAGAGDVVGFGECWSPEKTRREL